MASESSGVTRGARAATGIRVVVVSHGPPMRGGIATVAMDLVEDPGLCDEFEMVFINTAQNDDARGKFAWENIVRAFSDGWKTFLRARQGGVVHTHSVQHPVLVAWRQVPIALAARARGSRVLLHNHWGEMYMQPPGDYRVGRFHRVAFRVLDALSDVNILICESGEAHLRAYMPTIDLPTISNSVVVEEIAATTADHDPAVVLFIGEMLERKGLIELMDALDILERDGTVPFEMRIVGDNRPGLDPDKDAMVKLITDRGRAGQMTGPLPREEVYRHLGEADIYVLPTHAEGQPFTVIESLAAGVPIVATDIPTVADMVADGTNGRLVPLRNAAALAEAIRDLLEDPAERRKISGENRALARRRFDRTVFRRRMAELYRLHGRPSRRRRALSPRRHG